MTTGVTDEKFHVRGMTEIKGKISHARCFTIVSCNNLSLQNGLFFFSRNVRSETIYWSNLTKNNPFLKIRVEKQKSLFTLMNACSPMENDILINSIYPLVQKCHCNIVKLCSFEMKRIE